MDTDFQFIIDRYGLPPMWVRKNSFSTLVLIILEQQVSLASAYAAYKKLVLALGKITPEGILRVSDEVLRSCYLSRQKIVYVKELAKATAEGRLKLRSFHHQPDEKIRTELKKLKGIGDWTVDIYLLHSLQRTDIFPLGDLALVNALKEIKNLPASITKEEMEVISHSWKPYRSIATMLLWHHYIQKRKIRIVQ